ncbi:MAG: hypothetical protein ACR5K4_03225 [Sodalis sp. (in: enterobacteria)]
MDLLRPLEALTLTNDAIADGVHCSFLWGGTLTDSSKTGSIPVWRYVERLKH